MSNMSYCRFQNTRNDFQDCRYAMEEILEGGEEPLSGEELEAAKQLLDDAVEFVMLFSETLNIDSGNIEDLGYQGSVKDEVHHLMSGEKIK